MEWIDWLFLRQRLIEDLLSEGWLMYDVTTDDGKWKRIIEGSSTWSWRIDTKKLKILVCWTKNNRRFQKRKHKQNISGCFKSAKQKVIRYQLKSISRWDNSIYTLKHLENVNSFSTVNVSMSRKYCHIETEVNTGQYRSRIFCLWRFVETSLQLGLRLS